jgi:putative NADH-flavin reductase
MATRKVIAVFGATGAQGGSVVRAILENKQFAVRALTRDVARPNAVLLKDLGAEVVRCDLNDKASVEAALKGVHGAFLVTNFWDDFSKEKEECQHCPWGTYQCMVSLLLMLEQLSLAFLILQSSFWARLWASVQKH